MATSASCQADETLVKMLQPRAQYFCAIRCGIRCDEDRLDAMPRRLGNFPTAHPSCCRLNRTSLTMCSILANLRLISARTGVLMSSFVISPIKYMALFSAVGNEGRADPSISAGAFSPTRFGFAPGSFRL
jgi:hypothetical protein